MTFSGVLVVGTFLSESGRNASYCEELATRLEGTGLRVTRTSPQVGRIPRLVDMLATALRRRADYDVAHVDVFSGAAFVWAELVCFELRRLRKPYVLTLHGGNLPGFAARWPTRVRHLLASAAVVTAPSRYLGEQMAAYRRDLVVLPNAIDLRAYKFQHRERPAPRLVWVRALHSIYNPVLAVDVLAQLVAHSPGATLVMVGPEKGDGSKQAVEDRARALGVSERVELVGGVARSEVAAHLARADILLNTTNVDNTPLSVLEALACGLVVVSTNAGGLPYLLSHQREALLVPRRDASAMTAAVRRVLEEPGLAGRLSRGGRALAEACDWSVVLDQWIGTLAGASVAGAGGRGRGTDE
ncbi:MAG: glycosyltransferase family 4 protein [Deltaproteobacteria bacterium]|nr:glycosyltransferase family 4 protein [Deltaproteobacteria bacterium]